MDQAGRLLDRPQLYYNIDGVGELGIGFMCLAYALIGWLQIHTSRNSVWNQTYMFFIFLGLMCSIIHYGSKAIKKHITYPRTGFVEYRKRDRIWLPAIIGFGVSALVSMGLIIAIRAHWDMTTSASLIGLLFAASYAHGIARTVRWKWAVVWAMAFCSLAIAILPADLVGGLARGSSQTAMFPDKLIGAALLSMIVFGTLTLISGVISFGLYLRHTQPAAQNGQ